MAPQGHSVDEYLETIYFLAFPIGEYRPMAEGLPTVAVRVAEMLGVSRASAGEMLKRLEAEGLIERGEHKEALLTKAGRARAEKVVRKHRLIERLLTDFMGYTAAEAHVHADELGDTFSDDMVDRIAEKLGNPERCPHGWPVDPEFEQRENDELAPLADLDAGTKATIVRPRGARRRPPALVLRPGARARPLARGALDRAVRRASERRRGRSERRRPPRAVRPACFVPGSRERSRRKSAAARSGRLRPRSGRRSCGLATRARRRSGTTRRAAPRGRDSAARARPASPRSC